MGDVLRIGEPPIVVRLRRHARARRLVLRIPAPGRDPTLTLPPRASVASARGFLDAQEGWLRARLAAVAPPVRIGEGTRLPILGETVVVRLGSGSGVREREGELRVGGPADGCGASVARHLQRTARDFAAAAAARHAARLGRGHGRISLRDTRSRWGSCSATGDLMFSWRLVLAPVEVFDLLGRRVERDEAVVLGDRPLTGRDALSDLADALAGVVLVRPVPLLRKRGGDGTEANEEGKEAGQAVRHGRRADRYWAARNRITPAPALTGHREDRPPSDGVHPYRVRDRVNLWRGPARVAQPSDVRGKLSTAPSGSRA